MVKGFHEDRFDILVALYGFFLTEDGGHEVTARDLKAKAVLLYSTSYISLALKSLEAQSFVESDVGRNDEDVFTMTEDGVIRAEGEIQERGMTLDEFQVQFRRRLNSGLIVDTNNEYLKSADEVLSELEEHLRKDNDIGNLNADERDVALIEVGELREAITKPKVRTSYLWTKANEILLWITEKGAGAAVGELAKNALRHIHSFINVFFN